MSKVLTGKEVAAILRCSKAYMRNALHGKVPGLPKLMRLTTARENWSATGSNPTRVGNTGLPLLTHDPREISESRRAQHRPRPRRGKGAARMPGYRTARALPGLPTLRRERHRARQSLPKEVVGRGRFPKFAQNEGAASQRRFRAGRLGIARRAVAIRTRLGFRQEGTGSRRPRRLGYRHYRGL